MNGKELKEAIEIILGHEPDAVCEVGDEIIYFGIYPDEGQWPDEEVERLKKLGWFERGGSWAWFG